MCKRPVWFIAALLITPTMCIAQTTGAPETSDTPEQQMPTPQNGQDRQPPPVPGSGAGQDRVSSIVAELSLLREAVERDTPQDMVGRTTAVAAIIIAASGLFLSIYEAAKSQKHRRLSVQPRLEIERQISKKLSALILKNVGLGPAIVRKFEIRINGRTFRNWEEVFRHFSVSVSVELEHASLRENHALATDAYCYLLSLPEADNTEANQVILAGLIDQLEIEVAYNSFYGDPGEPVYWPPNPKPGRPAA